MYMQFQLLFGVNTIIYIFMVQNGSRLTKVLLEGVDVCVSITNIKGLVLARSATHHSINYDSVCIYGVFEKVSEVEKNQHMHIFMQQKMPERWDFVRPPNKKELAAVTILRIPIIEAVSKSRQGPPTDPTADLSYPVWAGVIPIETLFGMPIQAKEQNQLTLQDCPNLRNLNRLYAKYCSQIILSFSKFGHRLTSVQKSCLLIILMNSILQFTGL